MVLHARHWSAIRFAAATTLALMCAAITEAADSPTPLPGKRARDPDLSETTVRRAGVSAFAISRWQTEDGLPQNAVNAILQSREGYLWVGTDSGLARFDGERFTQPHA